ncbi:MAG: uroporphyrinogen decarboxylase family protein [Planctomycetota bacterium]|jgi:uroporphyrinogen-III decarboxylase
MSEDSAAAKTARVIGALEHCEIDRVPVGEFFWTNFLRRVKADWGVGDDFNPYAHWDLDMIVINPNMDPHVTGVEIVENSPLRRVVRTGFGATIEQRADYPMPHYADFETTSYEQIEALEFDDPLDPRRYKEAVLDQINTVADTLSLDYPSFVDRVDANVEQLCVFGSVCEPHELLWRIIGTENALMKIAEDPDFIARFIERIGDFLVGIVEGQVAAAEGALTGLYIWGDIAYDNGMFFSPDYWRRVYKPQLARICAAAHAHGLKTVYHGCGDASVVYEDMIEAGVDAYNPLEAKAGLDVVELKRRFGDRWAFNGNIDVRVLSTNDRDKVRREVLTKLNAAKGGGYIIQSDHSIPDTVSADTYDYMIGLARKHGNYPLDLGEFDLDA